MQYVHTHGYQRGASLGPLPWIRSQAQHRSPIQVELVGSLFEQSFADFEIGCVGDHSSHTRKIPQLWQLIWMQTHQPGLIGNVRDFNQTKRLHDVGRDHSIEVGFCLDKESVRASWRLQVFRDAQLAFGPGIEQGIVEQDRLIQTAENVEACGGIP